jgi:hypothetical protein
MPELSDDQFREHALEILERELGEAGVARFLRLNVAASGDFTRDRHKWQKGVTVREIADRIAKRKAASV